MDFKTLFSEHSEQISEVYTLMVEEVASYPSPLVSCFSYDECLKFKDLLLSFDIYDSASLFIVENPIKVFKFVE